MGFKPECGLLIIFVLKERKRIQLIFNKTILFVGFYCLRFVKQRKIFARAGRLSPHFRLFGTSMVPLCYLGARG
jgi:hypothetical protein